MIINYCSKFNSNTDIDNSLILTNQSKQLNTKNRVEYFHYFTRYRILFSQKLERKNIIE